MSQNSPLKISREPKYLKLVNGRRNALLRERSLTIHCNRRYFSLSSVPIQIKISHGVQGEYPRTAIARARTKIFLGLGGRCNMEDRHGSISYYSVLGLRPDCSGEEIRRAYRKLAMQWHPDRWTKTPSLLGEAKRNFQKIHEAYEVLSDEKKRTLYDAGLFDPEDEYDEGFCDFLQEMACLMTQEADTKENNCTMEDLQTLFMEMVQDFKVPSSSVLKDSYTATHSSSVKRKNQDYIEAPSSNKRNNARDSNLRISNSPVHVSGFAMYC
ncbi:hypothetical protein SAY86_026226 [Trapa natans]|uniref:J domain-containing protein n=1 Tax=Trapa natans TaxID=22666 RepID=A0AAN7QEC0_TRANT|nr:hypothetical protein SAY86_026226 [Trapa natans]